MTSHEWGCWNCGATASKVVKRSDDAECHPIRERQCLNCGAVFVTEERRLARGTRFWARADRLREQANERRRKSLTCRTCGGRYREGTYAAHRQIDRHVVALHENRLKRKRAARIRNRERYQTDPVFRARHIANMTERNRKVRQQRREPAA